MLLGKIKERAGKCREPQGHNTREAYLPKESWGQIARWMGQIFAEERIRVSDDTLDHDWKESKAAVILGRLATPEIHVETRNW